jgi:hypothetical protein
MSSDYIQRQMEFILEHRAKFSADIDRLTATVTRMASEMETDRRETREVLNSVICEIGRGFVGYD